RREPESHPVSPGSRSASPVRPIRAGRVSRPRLPLVPGFHSMTLRPSTAPQHVPLPSPPASSLPGDPDALDIPTPHSYAETIEGPYSSQWQAAMDAEMASWKSTGTYVDEVPPPGANI
ncbi:unnamed protein product, partial [Closterium sp. NIES-54]